MSLYSIRYGRGCWSRAFSGVVSEQVAAMLLRSNKSIFWIKPIGGFYFSSDLTKLIRWKRIDETCTQLFLFVGFSFELGKKTLVQVIDVDVLDCLFHLRLFNIFHIS